MGSACCSCEGGPVVSFKPPSERGLPSGRHTQRGEQSSSRPAAMPPHNAPLPPNHHCHNHRSPATTPRSQQTDHTRSPGAEILGVHVVPARRGAEPTTALGRQTVQRHDNLALQQDANASSHNAREDGGVPSVGVHNPITLPQRNARETAKTQFHYQPPLQHDDERQMWLPGVRAAGDKRSPSARAPDSQRPTRSSVADPFFLQSHHDSRVDFPAGDLSIRSRLDSRGATEPDAVGDNDDEAPSGPFIHCAPPPGQTLSLPLL